MESCDHIWGQCMDHYTVQTCVLCINSIRAMVPLQTALLCCLMFCLMFSKSCVIWAINCETTILPKLIFRFKKKYGGEGTGARPFWEQKSKCIRSTCSCIQKYTPFRYRCTYIFNKLESSACLWSLVHVRIWWSKTVVMLMCRKNSWIHPFWKLLVTVRTPKPL